MSTEHAPRPALRPTADYGDEDQAASRAADLSPVHGADIPWVYMVVVRRSSDGVYTARLENDAAVGRSVVSARAAIIDLMERVSGEVFRD